MAVIRNDVVRVDFETGGLKGLQQLIDDVEDLKKKLTGGIGDEEVDKLGDSAKKAKPPLEKVKEEAEKVKKSVTDIGKKAATTAFNGLKKIAGISFKALTVGIAGAATAIGGLVVKATQAFADYEQLIGGVETLFGTKGAKSVEEYAKIVGKSVGEVTGEYNKLKEAETLMMKNANNAYKSAGLSANQYMETVTSFSASLISSCGGDTLEAAKLADQALIDMSDNANKMGTDMELIIGTYQSMAKGNYAMLDNLKLGYGGTKKELERLIKDAAKLDKSVDANSMSYANIVKAIHAVQENMYITGTTQKEAEKTVTGSLNAMKASWGNLITAIGSGENLDQCMENMINSVETFGKNVIPVAERALGGIGTLIEKLVPVIEKKLPEIAEMLIPPLIKSAVSLTKGLIAALPNIVKSVATTIVDIFGDQFPIIKKIGDVFTENAEGIGDSLKKLIPIVIALVAAFKGFNAVKSISSLFKGFGGGSKGGGKKKGGLLGFFQNLAKMKPAVILKAMGNLAIIIGGFTALSAAIMFLAPYMAKLSDGKSLLEVISVMTALGVLGNVLTKFAGIAGKIPVMTVVKGLANMAIMIVGMTALSAAFMWVAPYVAKLYNGEAMFKVMAVITALGAVGTVLTVFAGIAGAIPIPVVLAGLANIALVLGGLTALVVAFGALTKIEGFNEFITKGGEILATMFNILGKCVGSVVGGLAEGITNSLPKIGENLSAFAESLKPLFTMFEGVDANGIGTFFKAIGSFMLQMGGNKIVEFFTGGPDFSGVVEGLKALTDEGVTKFFAMVNTIPTEAFTKGESFFKCLDGISSLPNTGGLGQWFSGENDYSGVASGLKKLSGEGVKKFFTMVGGLEKSSFDNATSFFKALDGISKLPNSGGMAQWFSGENDFEGVAEGLKTLSSDGVQRFFTMVNGINLDNLNGLWKSLKEAGKITTKNLSSALDDGMKDLVSKIKTLPKKMGDALKNNSKGLSDGMVSMWKDAVKASVKPVNKLLDGANHILKEFGSKKKAISWEPYASGTNGHKGGNALVNDGSGAELIQMPNGRMFIPRGRNVFLPNAPKGMKVLPAGQTARLMGRRSPTFRYADGIGNIDIWSYYDNAKGLVSKITEGISYKNMSSLAKNAGSSMVSTFAGEMAGWVDKLFNEEGGKSLASYVASKGVSQWKSTVVRALKMEGQYSAANVARTLFQMQTESGGNPRAINLWDSNAKKGIPSKGLMQVIDPTFKAYARAGFNKNIYDPLSNILASVRYATSRYGSLAKAYRGVGYSRGVGTVSIPQPSSMSLSYSPESDSGYYSSTSVETNTYAPHFELNISGTSDDRAMARKVKRWIAEAWEDMLDNFESKNPQTQRI